MKIKRRKTVFKNIQFLMNGYFHFQAQIEMKIHYKRKDFSPPS